jgi:hypothetical protein
LVALVPERDVSPAPEEQAPVPSGRPTPALEGDPVA